MGNSKEVASDKIKKRRNDIILRNILNIAKIRSNIGRNRTSQTNQRKDSVDDDGKDSSLKR